MQFKNKSWRDKQLKKTNQMEKSKARKKTETGKKTNGTQGKLFT